MKKICVYCGSSNGRLKKYMSTAKAMGETLAGNQLELVYGGANIGMMGAIANSCMANGGYVTGVIPKALFHKEVAHSSLNQLMVVKDMHERKSKMATLADGFITMPGGLGTLEELFEMLTWSQLGFHDKPIGLLNIEGYFDRLLDFIDHSIEQGFVTQSHRKLLCVSTNPQNLIDQMTAYQSTIIDKWTEKPR